jgi:Sec-independent protein secretion pathway component TatC
MNFAIKKGWGPAVVAAIVVIVLFMPADPVTEMLTLVQTFILTVVALLVLSRVALVADWPSQKQWLVSWSVALCAAVVVCLEPLLFAALKR